MLSKFEKMIKIINTPKKSRCRELARGSRAGQAALEFLTTYAWAFIVIIVLIGAIAYFGVLRPQKLLPDRCNFGSEFSCLAYTISATDNQLLLRLKNNLANPVTITSITLGSESSTQYTCTNPSLPSNFVSGNITDLTFTGCNTAAAGFVAGDKAKVLVKVNFYDITAGSTYGRQTQGEVYSTVI